MDVDVTTEIVIQRPRQIVAAYAADPDHAPSWYVNIKSVEWRSEPPLQVGSRIAFVARFLGRRLTYEYYVEEFVPGEHLVMRTAEGPFPMETMYHWETTPGGGTRMILRNRGRPNGPIGLFSPLLGAAIRRANERDLRRLRHILD